MKGMLVPEHLQTTMDKIKDASSTRKHQYYNLTFVRKDGTTFPTLTSCAKLTKTKDWDTNRLVTSVTDVSELKKAQAKLEDILESQRQTVKELFTPVIPI